MGSVIAVDAPSSTAVIFVALDPPYSISVVMNGRYAGVLESKSMKRT